MIEKLSGLSQEYSADTATYHDQVLEEMATEQEHLKELIQRLQGGEDSPELSEEYVDTISRLSDLYEAQAGLADDVDENRRWRGQSDTSHDGSGNAS